MSSSCNNCGKKNSWVEKWSTGDRVCSSCGMVGEERMISFEQTEYRIFEDDDDSKVRVGPSFSIFEHVNMCDKVDTDEKEFYNKGLLMLKDFFRDHFTDGRRAQIEIRAKEIFDYAFRKQKNQKEGDLTFLNKDKEKSKRQKYSRKKTYLVAAIWIAFMESGESENKWSIKRISCYFGENISEVRVKNCVKLLNFDPDLVRRQAQKQARDIRRRRRVQRIPRASKC